MATALHFAADATVCRSCGSPSLAGEAYCRACHDAISAGKPVKAGSILLLSNLKLARTSNPTKE